MNDSSFIKASQEAFDFVSDQMEQFPNNRAAIMIASDGETFTALIRGERDIIEEVLSTIIESDPDFAEIIESALHNVMKSPLFISKKQLSNLKF